MEKERTDQQIELLRQKLKSEYNKEFVPTGHFYSAVPDYAYIKKNIHRIQTENELSGIELNTSEQLQLLEKFKEYYSALPWEDSIKNGLRFCFKNDSYSYSDAIFYYSMILFMRPTKIIEVGSGYTSALACDVNEIFFNNEIQISLIEPYPSLVKKLLLPKDFEYINLHESILQDISLDTFRNLADNDILFIDSTHVSKTCSDVNYLIHEILPILNKNVIIHIHDIFYPFEYPEAWISQHRAWNEAYILRAFLQYNHTFKIIFFNTYLENKFSEKVYTAFPLAAKNPGGSIWIKKMA